MHGEQAMAVDVRWWRRASRHLFPHAPRPEIEGETRTYLTTDVLYAADWIDRLRFLVTGRLRVQIRTYTDVLVNECVSVSTCHVEGW